MSKAINKHISFYRFNGIPHRKEKKKSKLNDIYSRMKKSCRPNFEEKKANSQKYIHYDVIYMTF